MRSDLEGIESHNPYMNVPVFPQTGPIHLEEILGCGGPLELEIGFGKGHFILERALYRPETRLLGIETRRKWVHIVESRAKKRAIGNVVVRHGDARVLLKRMQPDRCFERVFINFPDPWWKAKHAKRMVVTQELGRDLARLLVPKGEIMIQTDVDFRADAYLEELSRVEDLEPLGPGGRVEKNSFGARSLREIRCEDLGMPVYRILFGRK